MDGQDSDSDAEGRASGEANVARPIGIRFADQPSRGRDDRAEPEDHDPDTGAAEASKRRRRARLLPEAQAQENTRFRFACGMKLGVGGLSSTGTNSIDYLNIFDIVRRGNCVSKS